MTQAAVAFALMALCVKAVNRTIPILEIVFFRSLLGTLILLGFVYHKNRRRNRISLLGQERFPMTMRAVFGFLALTLHFVTIAYLPLGTAVMLNYTAPIFVAVLAIFFLQERPSPFLISMIALSFCGVYLLVSGEFHEWSWMVFLGILSAVFAAIAYVSIRAVKHRESPFTVIFYFTGISTLGSLFFLPFGFVWPDFVAWLWLIGVGIGSFYGQLWMTIALRRAPASLISPFSYITPLLSFLFGMMFWNERLTLISVLGAFLIVLGGSLISYFETKV